jgi:branched-chain amino acid transport system substrate-binding protein
MKLRNPRLARTFVVAVVAALALAGCGGDDKGGSAGTDTGGLKGDPILLGSILTITNPAWNNQVMEDVNNAFASYINDQLGGIAGRPVKVESCDDAGDPAKTTQCFNNLVDKGVVGFVNNSSLAFGANALPTMEQKGLVNMGGWPVSSAEYQSKNEFLTSPGASGSYPSLAVFMKAQGADSLAMMYSNTPSGQAASDQIKALWESLGGGTYTGIEFDPTATDLTPAVAKAKDADPDGLILAVGEGAASRLFQSVQTAGIDAIVGATAAASGKVVQDAAGSAMDGVYFSFASVPSTMDREDTKTYTEVMTKYAPKTELTNQGAVAASGMMFAYDTLKNIKGDITKDSVTQAVQGTTTWDGFLVHGYDSAAAPAALPAVGNPWNLVTQYKDGAFSAVQVPAEGDTAAYVQEDGDLSWLAGSPASS